MLRWQRLSFCQVGGVTNESPKADEHPHRRLQRGSCESRPAFGRHPNYSGVLAAERDESASHLVARRFSASALDSSPSFQGRGSGQPGEALFGRAVVGVHFDERSDRSLSWRGESCQVIAAAWGSGGCCDGNCRGGKQRTTRARTRENSADPGTCCGGNCVRETESEEGRPADLTHDERSAGPEERIGVGAARSRVEVRPVDGASHENVVGEYRRLQDQCRDRRRNVIWVPEGRGPCKRVDARLLMLGQQLECEFDLDQQRLKDRAPRHQILLHGNRHFLRHRSACSSTSANT